MRDVNNPRPSLLWRGFALGGAASLTVLATHDPTWERWEESTGGAVPRSTVRTVLGVTVALHVVESLVAGRIASKAGLDRPGRWRRATLLYGFPVLRRVRRAARAADAT